LSRGNLKRGGERRIVDKEENGGEIVDKKEVSEGVRGMRG